MGVYLPLSTSTPIMVGGIVRYVADKTAKRKVAGGVEADSGPGVLFSSGLIAGASVIGTVLAFLQLSEPTRNFLNSINVSAKIPGFATSDLALAPPLLRPGRRALGGGDGTMAGRPQGVIEVRVASTPKDVQTCLSLRWTVFVEEQGVRPSDEQDAHDAGDAVHALALLDGVPCGAGRFIFAQPGVAKIERMAVVDDVRRRGVGKALLAFLEAEAVRRGASRLTSVGAGARSQVLRGGGLLPRRRRVRRRHGNSAPADGQAHLRNAERCASGGCS